MQNQLDKNENTDFPEYKIICSNENILDDALIKLWNYFQQNRFLSGVINYHDVLTCQRGAIDVSFETVPKRDQNQLSSPWITE